ncbi:MAG: hypothetical protein J2P28_06005 [Actinobacteria bacterium]|nr:hypothetical protein [Actinomycetota bacterium]
MLLFASGAMLLIWAISTWAKRHDFDSAVSLIFNAEPDADTTVKWLQFLYATAAALSIALAFALVVAAALISRGSSTARVGAWITGVLTLPVLWFVFIRNGRDYLSAVGTGPSDPVARAEMARVNQLTPWRFAGWYHVMTATVGVAVACSIIAALILLPFRLRVHS